jgi:hypothetical protein
MAGLICSAGKEAEAMTPKKQGGRAAGGGNKPVKKTKVKVKVKVKAPKRKRATDPTRDAPFDVTSDGDFASLRHDLSEDEIKEQADRQKAK